MGQLKKYRANKYLVFAGILTLINLCFFVPVYFFGRSFSIFGTSGDLFNAVMLHFLVSLIFWIRQPIKNWKKPLAIAATTAISSFVALLLLISTLSLPGSRNPKYIEYEICNPAVRNYYRERYFDEYQRSTFFDGLPEQAHVIDENGDSRSYAQTRECVENVLNGKEPAFSENPPGFALTPSPTPIIYPTIDPTTAFLWKTYNDNTDGYIIKYPDVFTLEKQSRDGSTLVTIYKNKRFIPPGIDSPMEPYPTSLSIQVLDIPKDINPQLGIKNANDFCEKELCQNLKIDKDTKKEIVVINNISGVKIYSHIDNPRYYLDSPDGNKIILITIIAAGGKDEKSNMEDFSLLQKVLSTLKFPE